jgi:G2/mitotic-specific cyclin 1/2
MVSPQKEETTDSEFASEEEYSDVDTESESEDNSPFSSTWLNRADLSKVGQYVMSVFNCARSDLSCTGLSPERVFKVQTSILSEHREVAVTRMLSVQQRYEMSSETLFEAVGYLNRLLGQYDCPCERLDLFALTSFWMAAKLEESGAPKKSDLCYLARDQYTENDFVQCERFILQLPGFQFTFPTAPLFLRSFLDAIEANAKVIETALFFCDLSQIPMDFIGTRPEVIAVACVGLAKVAFGDVCPTKRLMLLAGLESFDEPRNCCTKLIEFAKRIMAHPRHLLYHRYTVPPAGAAILEMHLSDDLLERLS